MNEKDNDFMVDLVNSELPITDGEIIAVLALAVLVIAALVWWVRRK